MSLPSLTVAALGLDTMHAPGMLAGMLDAGATAKGFWTDGSPVPLENYLKRFPDVPRYADAAALIEAPDVDLVLISSIPDQRAGLAIAAMEAGKDVMVDKPGCVTLAELEEIRRVVARTGRIWSVNYGEHFEQPSVLKAAELIGQGAIGRVIQTIGLGPHRLNRGLRKPWFFERKRHGGILADIGSHHISQFLLFTGLATAEVKTASVGNYAHPDDPELEDFAEMLLEGDGARGYIRLDWLGPDSLPHPGDGRVTILGTEGYIELRKYLDLNNRPGAHHVYLVNGTRCEHIDATSTPVTYFHQLAADVRERTETAMTQSHCFEVMRLALEAEAMATRLGGLAMAS